MMRKKTNFEKGIRVSEALTKLERRGTVRLGKRFPKKESRYARHHEKSKLMQDESMKWVR